jgi:PadR family transcriptional regulator, regulatory protein PadR
MDKKDKFNAVRKGLLEFLILKIVAARKVYALEILEELNCTQFKTQEGTLYPLLSKIRREGCLEYEWIESEAGPPRKYYSLTAQGKEELASFKKYWQEITDTINHLGT